MSEQIKLSGGPMKGQYHAIQHWTDRIAVQGLDREEYVRGELDSLILRTGDYARSNERLKNGTVIYKWMGWRQ